MSIGQNKALVRAFVEEAQVKGNLASIDQYLSPDFVDHSALPGIPPTRGCPDKLYVRTSSDRIDPMSIREGDEP